MQEQQEQYSKGSETSAIWRIFAELNNPKRALSKVNLTSMDVSMF